jgi:carboxymethylenebutenolidase
LRDQGCTSVFTVGFCFGGRNSWLAAGAGHEVSGAVGFYGRSAQILDEVPRFDAPILALQGGADAAIPHEENAEFERVLREHRKQYELIEYEGAPHSFFDRKQEEFAEASDDAWRRVLEFIGRYE